MPDCVFCQIVAGNISSHKVYEDEGVLAFLDAQPINPGHSLVVPKNHVDEFQEMSEDLYDHVMEVVHQLARDIKTKLHPARVGVAVHGYEVPHTHIHVIPTNSAADLAFRRGPKPTDSEMAAVAKQLRE